MPFLAAIPAIIAGVASAAGAGAAAAGGAVAGAAGAVGGAIGGAAGAIGSAAGAAGSAIGSAAGSAGSAIGGVAADAAGAISSGASGITGSLGIGGGGAAGAAPVGTGTVLAPTAGAMPMEAILTGVGTEVGAGTVLAPMGATTASATGGGGVMNTVSNLMSLFGDTPEERMTNLNDLSQVLSGASKMMKGAHKNKFEERTFQPYIAERGASVAGPVPQIPSGMNTYLAAKMITEMGFGRR